MFFLCNFRFQNFKAVSMGILEFDSARKYIEDIHTVYPAIEGRIIMIKEDSKPGSAPRPSAVSMSVLFITIISILNYFQ